VKAIDLSMFLHGGVNITGFQLLDPGRPHPSPSRDIQQFLQEWNRQLESSDRHRTVRIPRLSVRTGTVRSGYRDYWYVQTQDGPDTETIGTYRHRTVRIPRLLVRTGTGRSGYRDYRYVQTQDGADTETIDTYRDTTVRIPRLSVHVHTCMGHTCTHALTCPYTHTHEHTRVRMHPLTHSNSQQFLHSYVTDAPSLFYVWCIFQLEASLTLDSILVLAKGLTDMYQRNRKIFRTIRGQHWNTNKTRGVQCSPPLIFQKGQLVLESFKRVSLIYRCILCFFFLSIYLSIYIYIYI
jgi:hypothetical protein